MDFRFTYVSTSIFNTMVSESLYVVVENVIVSVGLVMEYHFFFSVVDLKSQPWLYSSHTYSETRLVVVTYLSDFF